MPRTGGTPVTFRAAGTSLSGQAIDDSVLCARRRLERLAIRASGAGIRLQPGVIGGHANRFWRRYGRKIGPDPASINAAKIGGIVANNASGMCCGTAQNSYHTLAGMRLVLADGTVLDTEDAAQPRAFSAATRTLLDAGDARQAGAPGQRPWRAHPPQVSDEEHHRLQPERADRFRRPLDILHAPDDRLRRHAGLHRRRSPTTRWRTTRTRPARLILFDDLQTACAAVTALKRDQPVSAVELLDRAALRSVENKAGMPACLKPLADPGRRAAGRNAEACAAEELRRSIRAVTELPLKRALAGIATAAPIDFTDRSGRVRQRCGKSARTRSRRSARCARPAPR